LQNVALTAKRALLGVVSCVTKSFHDETLGSYGDLIGITTALLGQKPLETVRLPNALNIANTAQIMI